jgi:hypothetical protein
MYETRTIGEKQPAYAHSPACNSLSGSAIDDSTLLDKEPKYQDGASSYQTVRKVHLDVANDAVSA